jgi:hypothetical protein
MLSTLPPCPASATWLCLIFLIFPLCNKSRMTLGFIPQSHAPLRTSTLKVRLLTLRRDSTWA